MARMYIDCRHNIRAKPIARFSIAADTKKELIDAAVQHAVAVHGHKDSPELREQIGRMIKSTPW